MKVTLDIDHTVSKEEIESWITEVLIPNTPCVWGYSFNEHHCNSCSNTKLEKEIESLRNKLIQINSKLPTWQKISID